MGPLASPELWLVQKEVCIKLIKPKTGDKNRKRTDHQKISQTLLATANSTHENASSLRVKTEVLNGMAPDDISFDARKDLLIRLYGEYY